MQTVCLLQTETHHPTEAISVIDVFICGVCVICGWTCPGSRLIQGGSDEDDWLLTVAGLYLHVTGDFDVKVRMPVHGTEEHQTHCLGAFTADRRNFVHIDNIASTPDHVRFRAINADGTVVAGRLAIPQQRWFRLTRTWDMFRAYYGSDGVHWTEVGSGISRPNLPATLHVGLLAWPPYPDKAFQAQFDNFEIMIPGGTAAERR